MTGTVRLAAVIAAAALLVGADGSDRTLDLTAPQPFPIHGDVPVVPPPALPPPAASPEAPAGGAAALPAAPSPPPAGGLPAAPPGSARPLPGAAPRSAPPPVTAPQEPAAPLGPASFTVQVGAFRSAEQARALAQRLAARGYDAFVVTVDLGAREGQGTWHRVRVGRFPDRQPAVELATRLAGTERVPAQVLRETAPAP